MFYASCSSVPTASGGPASCGCGLGWVSVRASTYGVRTSALQWAASERSRVFGGNGEHARGSFDSAYPCIALSCCWHNKKCHGVALWKAFRLLHMKDFARGIMFDMVGQSESGTVWRRVFGRKEWSGRCYARQGGLVTDATRSRTAKSDESTFGFFGVTRVRFWVLFDVGVCVRFVFCLEWSFENM